MTDAFDINQSNWTFSAFPAPILFTTQLPILNKYVVNRASLPQPTHDAAWWEAKSKGFDFSQEDRVDPDKFNRVIWEGLMGDRPYPTVRSGADLRQNRERLLKNAAFQPATQEPVAKGGGE